MIDLKGFGGQLVEGTAMTIAAGLTAMAVATLLGLLGASMKLSRSPSLRHMAGIYTTTIRGVPELVMLLLVYFGGTVLLQKIADLLGSDQAIDIDAFAAGTGVLGFVYGAFATEVFRGAVLAVPKGQIEAAKACGMSRLLIFRRILMPQVLRFALPGLGNVWLVLLKATALMSIVGLPELLRKASIASQQTKLPFTFYLAALIIYLMLTAVSQVVLQSAERRSNRGVRQA